ncbi:MAG: hypothetical protein PVF80_15605 [Gammaproteobacteria bacterium]|jgi:hypothetical protein
MNRKLNEFIETLKLFISQLENSGKSETAQYYRNILEELGNEAGSTDALDRVITSGSISQYANLTSDEDEIFEMLHEKAINLKRSDKN